MIALHFRPNDRQPWQLVATVASIAEALDLMRGSGDWWLRTAGQEALDHA